LLAAKPAPAPLVSAPAVEMKGVIKQVHIARGQGAPFLDVQQGAAVTKVYLGSMRYLIAENFNPKAGQEIVVKGFKTNNEVVATEVMLPAEKKTLKLRDGQGRPLWRGGPWRGGRGPR
jgi:hypothetical protein